MANNINIPNKQSGEQFTADEFNLLLNGVNSAITEFNTNLVSVEKIEWIEGDTKPEIVADVILGTISEGETKYVQIVKVGEQNVAILHSPNHIKQEYEEIFTSFDVFNLTSELLTYTTIDNIVYMCNTYNGQYDTEPQIPPSISLAKYENNEFIIIDVLTDLESGYYLTRFVKFHNQLLSIVYDSTSGDAKIIVIDLSTDTRNTTIESKLNGYVNTRNSILVSEELASDAEYLYVPMYTYDDETETTGKLEIHKFDSNYDFVEIFYQEVEIDSISITSVFCKDGNLYLGKFIPGSGQVIRINTTTKILDPTYGGVRLGNLRPYVLSVFNDNSLLLAISELPGILSPDGQTLNTVGLDLFANGELPTFTEMAGFKPQDEIFCPIMVYDVSENPSFECGRLTSDSTITKFTPPIMDKGILMGIIPTTDFILGIIATDIFSPDNQALLAYKLTPDYDYKFPIEIEVDYYAKFKDFKGLLPEKVTWIEGGDKPEIVADKVIGDLVEGMVHYVQYVTSGEEIIAYVNSENLEDLGSPVGNKIKQLQSDLGGLKLVKLYESEYQALDLADEIDDNTMYIRLPDPLISE